MSGMGAAVARFPLDATPERDSRRGTAALASVIAAAGGVACALSLAAPALRGLPLHPLDQAIHTGVAAAWIGTGVVALVRRPGNATGLLMAAVGFLWLVGDLYWIPGALAFTIAATFALFYQNVLAHLALSFPTGRLPGGFERWVVVGLYAWALVNNLVRMLFFDPHAEGCAGCPANLLLVVHDPGAARWRNNVSSYLDTAVIVVVGAVIVRHWWRRTRAARYVITPVLWAAVPALAYLVTREVADDFVTLSPTGARIVYQFLPLGLVVWPLLFLVGLLRTRFDYARVGALLPQLAGPVAPGRVRDALAATLHDPQLELLYWSPVTDGYVDLDGQPREPVAAPGRTMAPIRGEGGPLAVMLVDEIALQEPALLQAAGAMARLALENERLQAEVRSQLVQLRSTTTRLVEAGQDARQRIERDLHDGAQQRLLALSMTLGQARACADGADPQLRAFLDHAADDLQQAIGELRELARGIHPMLLTQEGLASALTALAERAPLPVQVSAPTCRFPDTVESTAYFFVAEAVTNAARHAAASAVQVEVTVAGEELTVWVSDDGIGGANPADRSGSGLLGIRDRVVALGGRMSVTSPTGGGTAVVARLPCG
jgi:signal transduction histidine kinase